MKTSSIQMPRSHRFLHPEELNYKPLESVGVNDWRNAKNYLIDADNPKYSRLAWELLRRNKYFQKFCDDYFNSDLSDWDIPVDTSKWGLKRFKHYKDGHQTLESPEPAWLLPTPANLIPNLFMQPARQMSSLKEPVILEVASSDRPIPPLKSGQVAVIFDLQSMLPFKGALSNQLLQAKKDLEKLMTCLDEITDQGARVAGAHSNSVISSIRLADALAVEKDIPRMELARTLFPEVIESMGEKCWGDREVQGRMNDEIKVAAKLIYEKGYLSILLKDQLLK